MGKNGNKIKAILDLLTAELSVGILYLQIVSTLHAKFAHSDLLTYPCLLSGTYQACFNQALLSLAKLGIHERESVSIEYLLNCASQNTKAFRYASREQIEQKIESHRHLLQEKQPLFERVKVLRDRILAHLDRKHINEPGLFERLDVDFYEIGQCFEIFTEILNTYKGYFDRSHLDLSSSIQIIQKDIDRLAGLA
ncbi:MAG: hypothetical protein IBX69_19860 [Anaerolineales bacterium]|nr:hypothetical protein [Anaerolineales bacterium]